MTRHSNRSLALRFAAAIGLPCVLAVACSAAQPPPAVGPVRSVVVLDPAHGGPEAGARLGDQVLEKDVTLALAAKLRPALTAAGFTVVTTREGELSAALTTDQRAELANRQHALACVVLHATASGSGVHVYASALQGSAPVAYDPDVRPPFTPVPWDQAQTDWVGQSLRLQDHLSEAVGNARMPVLRGRASVPPLDNLTCPAIALELAPLGAAGGDRVPASDGGYQQRVAQAVVAALKSWRDDPESHPAAAGPAVRPAAPAGASQ